MKILKTVFLSLLVHNAISPIIFEETLTLSQKQEQIMQQYSREEPVPTKEGDNDLEFAEEGNSIIITFNGIRQKTSHGVERVDLFRYIVYHYGQISVGYNPATDFYHSDLYPEKDSCIQLYKKLRKVFEEQTPFDQDLETLTKEEEEEEEQTPFEKTN